MRNTLKFQSIFHLTLTSPIRSDYECYSTHTGDTGELYECDMPSTHFDLNQLQQRTLENAQLIESQPNFVHTFNAYVVCRICPLNAKNRLNVLPTRRTFIRHEFV